MSQENVEGQNRGHGGGRIQAAAVGDSDESDSDDSDSDDAGGAVVRSPLLKSFLPLIVDVGIPLGSYYLLKEGVGLSTVAALGWSSVPPALRTVWGVIRGTGINGLAVLILLVNVVSVVMSTMTGDARLMLAKDSGVSSVVGIGVITSVFMGRPLMTVGLKPWVTKGTAAGNAAWDRLIAGSAPFRRAERRFSLIWGTVLLVECVVKVIGAYTVPVHTMVWLGTVLTVVALMLAMVVAGGVSADPMAKMVKAEVKRDAAEVVREADERHGEAGAGAAAAVAAETGS